MKKPGEKLDEWRFESSPGPFLLSSELLADDYLTGHQRVFPSDIGRLSLTQWDRTVLWCKFFIGLLDRFQYEDEEVYLSGFRDPR